MELKGAEVMAAGTWRGAAGGTNTFTVADLDSIVAAFDALGLSGRVPLKLGHDGGDARDGEPALGWVEKLYRKGDRLLADFVSVPRVIFDAIKAGLYRTVSVEMLGNVQAGSRRIPWVLDAVALLGATQPAVGILEDLSKLTVMARGCGLQGASRIIFKRGGDPMTDEVAELRAQLAEQNKQLVNMAFSRAIAERRCLPAAQVQFSKRFGDTGSLADVEEWVSCSPKPPARGPATLSTSAADIRTHEFADDEVAERVQVLMKARKAEGEPAISDIDATVLVLRADPGLGQRYMNLYPPVTE